MSEEIVDGLYPESSYDVASNGAVGDGIADDGLIFQRLIDHFDSKNIPGCIYVPAGIYRLLRPIIHRGPGLRIVGENAGATIICEADGCLQLDGAGRTSVEDINMTIRGPVRYGITSTCPSLSIDRCTLNGFATAIMYTGDGSMTVDRYIGKDNTIDFVPTAGTVVIRNGRSTGSARLIKGGSGPIILRDFWWESGFGESPIISCWGYLTLDCNTFWNKIHKGATPNIQVDMGQGVHSRVVSIGNTYINMYGQAPLIDKSGKLITKSERILSMGDCGGTPDDFQTLRRM